MKKLKDVLSEHKSDLLIIVIVMLAVSISWFFWGYDNPYEQSVEKEIKLRTNQDIDLSPPWLESLLNWLKILIDPDIKKD